VPVGHVPVGQVPVPHVPVGQVPVGQVPVPHEPVGQVPVGQVPVPHEPVGQVPVPHEPVPHVPVGALLAAVLFAAAVLAVVRLLPARYPRLETAPAATADARGHRRQLNDGQAGTPASSSPVVTVAVTVTVVVAAAVDRRWRVHRDGSRRLPE
jgi:hypothetical protein